MEDYQYIIHDPGTLDYAVLQAFLVDTEDMFSPKLSDRLDLEEYAKKLTSRAYILACHHENQILGLTAIYYNPNPEYSFSTMFCVRKEYQKSDVIGIKLQELLRDFWKEHPTQGIRFDIRKSNKQLVRYHKIKGAQILCENIAPNSDEVELRMQYEFKH